MFKLVQNEWMKLWSKKGTWVLVGLLILFISSMLLLTKWIQSTNEKSVESETPNGSVDVSVQVEEGLHTWQDEVNMELMMTTDRLRESSITKEEKERLESKVKVLEYRIAENVAPVESNSRERIVMDSAGIGSIAVLLTVIVAAGIVATEFSQGTIKMLLSRPVKRWKILTSKYIVVNLFGLLLMITGFVVSIICSYLLFEAGSGQELQWNGTEIVEVSAWSKGLYTLLLSFGNVFITSTFAFMIGSVFRSSSLAIGLSLFIYFTGSTVVMLLSKYEIVKYIVFTHMDLTIYQTDYRIVEDVTLSFSLAVLAAYLVLFLLISFVTFIKRDVKA